MSEIKSRLTSIEARIAAACMRAGRKREDVKLIAVSKTVPLLAMKEAMDEGIMVFGENKVQELVKKSEALSSQIEWHMIGHLQANKVKYLPNRVSLIHSVDNRKLAVEIQKIGEKHQKVIPILVQLNIAREATKFGLPTDEVYDFVKEISTFSHIALKGLMTIPPFVENAEENREYFRKMNEIMVDLNAKNIDNVSMNVLSMGMTDDFEVAIEEGATLIRIGTGIFGERTYL